MGGWVNRATQSNARSRISSSRKGGEAGGGGLAGLQPRQGVERNAGGGDSGENDVKAVQHRRRLRVAVSRPILHPRAHDLQPPPHTQQPCPTRLRKRSWRTLVMPWSSASSTTSPARVGGVGGGCRGGRSAQRDGGRAALHAFPPPPPPSPTTTRPGRRAHRGCGGERGAGRQGGGGGDAPRPPARDGAAARRGGRQACRGGGQVRRGGRDPRPQDVLVSRVSVRRGIGFSGGARESVRRAGGGASAQGGQRHASDTRVGGAGKCLYKPWEADWRRHAPLPLPPLHSRQMASPASAPPARSQM